MVFPPGVIVMGKGREGRGSGELGFRGGCLCRGKDGCLEKVFCFVYRAGGPPPWQEIPDLAIGLAIYSQTPAMSPFA